MGFNKLLAPLAGKPVLAWTLEAFENCDAIHELILVGGDEARSVAETAGFSKVKCVVPGGAERHLSVSAGLEKVSDKATHVAVHDGGRPLVTPRQITLCVQAALEHGAVTCARRVTETLKRCDAEGRIIGGIDRDGAWIMETPQVFELALLRRAYDQVLADGLLVTDEVSAIQHIGGTVRVVENAEPNLKVTYPGDLQTVAKLLMPSPGQSAKEPA